MASVLGITRATPIADLPQLLRVAEAAAWLGLSRGTVYGAIREGTVPSVSVGRLVFVPRAGLAKLVGATDDGGGA